nr:McrC family protein [Lewinella sp. W8]
MKGTNKALLSKPELEALTAFHACGGHRYYDLIHRGVKFKSYVGVLRVGKLTIEVLPKLDNHGGPDFWRNRLLDMLAVVPSVTALHPTSSHLRTRPNSILEHYLLLYANELEVLLRGGLAKAYHGRTGNRTALRGRLVMSRHLTENLVHKERFFVEDTVYDYDHPLNRILGQALRLAGRLATTASLRNRLGALSLRFPDLPDQWPITEETFSRLRYDRRTEAYRPAVQIARLLLLNYHPDLRSGRRDVLALLFDMNKLWEGFLLQSLRRFLPAFRVSGRTRAKYWQGRGIHAGLEPDLAIYREESLVALLDAKWKVPKRDRPSPADLQQLFTYAGHFGADRVALVYPSASATRTQVPGAFVRTGAVADLLWLPVGETTTRAWMAQIAGEVGEWLGN